MQTYTPYQERIRKCFADAYKFIDEYKHPRTDEDWGKIAKGIVEYTHPLTVDLIVACAAELEREYHEYINTGKD